MRRISSPRRAAAIAPGMTGSSITWCSTASEDAYDSGRSMGDFGEATAEAYQFTRAEQDAFAVETLTRRARPSRAGRSESEIVPISVPAKGGEPLISDDEIPLKVSPEKIPSLKPGLPAQRNNNGRPARPPTLTARRRSS